MAEHTPDDPLVDFNAASMFYTCALDLLAQTEAQYRAVAAAQTRLESCLAEWSVHPPTPEKRQERLSVIATLVRKVAVTVRAQRDLAVEMQRAMSALQTNGKQS